MTTLVPKITVDMFFRPNEILKAKDNATKRYLFRSAALVRKIARRSMRVRKGTSAPGSPPNAHTRALKDAIFFGIDRPKEQGVIGPLKTRTAIADTLEFGGTVLRRDNRGRQRRIRRVRIAPRPYMQPALDKSVDKLAEFWADSFK